MSCASGIWTGQIVVWEQAYLEMNQSTWLPAETIALRLLLACVFGAVIGFEREWRSRAAGLRTHILVSLAAALVSILSIEIVHMQPFAGESVRVDPLRIIEAVTSGVAFLAAGLIFVARGHVQGLTTGAGMWLAGAVGVATGLGLWHVAAATTVLALAVLAILGTFSKRLSDGDARQSGSRERKADG